MEMKEWMKERGKDRIKIMMLVEEISTAGVGLSYEALNQNLWGTKRDTCRS